MEALLDGKTYPFDHKQIVGVSSPTFYLADVLEQLRGVLVAPQRPAAQTSQIGVKYGGPTRLVLHTGNWTKTKIRSLPVESGS